MSERDTSKLPKWAQNEITRLERDLASARRKLAAGPEDSDTFADPYAKAPRPLGRGSTIRFHLAEDGHVDVRTEVDHRDRTFLRVMGIDSCAVLPESSNVVRILLSPR